MPIQRVNFGEKIRLVRLIDGKVSFRIYRLAFKFYEEKAAFLPALSVDFLDDDKYKR